MNEERLGEGPVSGESVGQEPLATPSAPTASSTIVVTPAETQTPNVVGTPNSVVTQGTGARESVRRAPAGTETARRVVVFVFGIVQALIVLRIVLLLVDASQANGIVRFIYDVSGAFVAPFEGVLHTNAVHSGASIFDLAALVAIVGWTLLEFLIIAGIGIARREPQRG